MCHSIASTRRSIPTSWLIARLRAKWRERETARPTSAAVRSGQRPRSAVKRWSRIATWTSSSTFQRISGGEGVGLVGLPRQEQVPASEQLGDRPLEDVDPAREEPVHDEQAEVGGTLLGGGGARSPLARAEPLRGGERQRRGFGHRRRSQPRSQVLVDLQQRDPSGGVRHAARLSRPPRGRRSRDSGP